MKKFTVLMMFLTTMVVNAQQWEISYQSEKNEYFSGGTMVENGNYLVGITTFYSTGYDYRPVAIFIDNDDNYIRKVFTTEKKKSFFNSSMKLNGDSIIVIGLASDDDMTDAFEYLWLSIMNSELEIVKEEFVPLDENYYSWRDWSVMTKSYDNNIAMMVQEERLSGDGDLIFMEVDDDLNVLKKVIHTGHRPSGGVPHDLEKIPGTEEYLLIGEAFDVAGHITLSRFDKDLEYIAHSVLPFDYSVCCINTDYWYDDEEFLIPVRRIKDASSITDYYTEVLKMNITGDVSERLPLMRVDTSDYLAQYCNNVYINDSTIYILSAVFSLYNFYDPEYLPTTVTMIDKDLNLLGRKEFGNDCDIALSVNAQPTKDGGVIVHSINVTGEKPTIVQIFKVLREDIELIVSVSDNIVENIDVDIFPNPANDIVNIKTSGFEMRNARIQVYDIAGRMFLDKTIGSNGNILTIDVSPLNSGTYCCKIIDGDDCILTGTFIKK